MTALVWGMQVSEQVSSRNDSTKAIIIQTLIMRDYTRCEDGAEDATWWLAATNGRPTYRLKGPRTSPCQWNRRSGAVQSAILVNACQCVDSKEANRAKKEC